MPIDIGKGELHGFDLQVAAHGAVHRMLTDVQVLQDARGHLRGDALTIGWNLMQGVVAVVLGQGRDPLGRIGGQVGGAEHSPMGLHIRGDRLCNLTAIEGLAIAARDLPQGAGSSGHGKVLAHLGRSALGQKDLSKARLAGEFLNTGGQGPLLLHHHRHGIAALSDLHGGGQHVPKRQAAQAPVQRHPT